jgi:phytoene dehydrogenase-like protein
MQRFHGVIIGGGLSGLAAGVRASLMGQRVVILEQHNAVGGLNGFYSFHGRKYDVGLHAMTNFCPPRQAGPLLRVLRQLRLDRDALELGPQKGSAIQFPHHKLFFNNDFRVFRASVAENFPQGIDAFDRMVADLPSFDEALMHPERTASGRAYLEGFGLPKALIEMILCAVCFYGSARPNDVDFAQLAVLFRSIFCEGLGRPREGIRVLIRALLDRFRQNGGERRMKCAVKALHSKGERIEAVELENGEILQSNWVLSSVGLMGTNQLLGQPCVPGLPVEPNPLSFVETVQFYPLAEADPRAEETIIFFSEKEDFIYDVPNALWDDQSGVICFSHQYHFDAGHAPQEGCLRVTALANPLLWKSLGADEYTKAKQSMREGLMKKAYHYQPHLRQVANFLDEDSFTPKTIERFTRHSMGAVYGNRYKNYDGTTQFANLRLCGTDQGLLGIVGAMLSGTIQANAFMQ